MKTAILLAFSLIILNSCSEPSVEEKIKSLLQNQEKTSVSEVRVGDTVFVKTLNARLAIIGLDEAKRNLSKVSHPALTFGFNDIINSQKKNIESFTNLIDQNNALTETIKKECEQIKNKLHHAGDVIAYIKVSAKVDQSLKEYIISPDLKIIK